MGWHMTARLSLTQAQIARAIRAAKAEGLVPIKKREVPCNVRKGEGWLPLSDAEIVRRTCEEARRVYWPAFEARIGGVG